MKVTCSFCGKIFKYDVSSHCDAGCHGTGCQGKKCPYCGYRQVIVGEGDGLWAKFMAIIKGKKNGNHS